MAAIVVDASALSALVFDEPEAPAVLDALIGHTLTAPTLLIYEVGNVCWTKCRRHPRSASGIRKAFADLSRFDIGLHEIDPPGVLAIAQRNDVTYYDAAYLWLSKQLEARLVTLDRRLRRIAGTGPAH